MNRQAALAPSAAWPWTLAAFALGACPEPEPLVPGLEWCSGGEDEDLDGAADCEDPDCEQHVLCRQAFVQFDALSERYGWVLPDEADLSVWGLHSGGDLRGDVDGDSKPDLALSLSWAPNQGSEDSGEWARGRATLIQPRSSSNSGDWMQLQEEATRLSTSEGLAVGAMESACDIDGDGYDDVVTMANFPSNWDFAKGEPEAVRIGFGRKKWPPRSPEGAAPVVPTLGIRLPAEFAGAYASLHCMGDVDGDGRDDLLAWNYWLSPEHLAEGKLLPEVGYRWNLGGVPEGDIDGDGWVDLRGGLNETRCGDPLEVFAVGRFWKGGPELAPQNTTLPADAWTTPPAPIALCADRPERNIPPDHGAHSWFHDLSGDGRPEILIDFGQEYLDVFDGNSLGDLSSDVYLRRMDVVARMHLRELDPADPGSGDWIENPPGYRDPSVFRVDSAGDIDGDGAIDLLVQLDIHTEHYLDRDRCPVCGDPWWGNPHSWAVYFGTPGDLRGFERPWYAMDALMGAGDHRSRVAAPLGAAATIIEDSDGDGMREILFYGSAAVSAADLDDPFLLPTAGVMPGSALAAWKIE